jgi:DNA-binding phage protein
MAKKSVVAYPTMGRYNSDLSPNAKEWKELAPFKASKYLTDEETISEFLIAALEDEDPEVLVRAMEETDKVQALN